MKQSRVLNTYGGGWGIEQPKAPILQWVHSLNLWLIEFVSFGPKVPEAPRASLYLILVTPSFIFLCLVTFFSFPFP